MGLDAITFLRFIRMCCWITTILGIVLAAVLFPVDIVVNLHNNNTDTDGSSKSSALSYLNLSQISGSPLWAHVIMSYVACLVSLYFVYRNYKRMVALRWAFFRSDAYQTSFAARTLMLTGVPRPLQSDQALASLLSSTGMPYPTTEVHIGREVGSLPDLIEAHDDTVRKLERVFAKYLKDPNKVAAHRPTVRIGKTLGMFGGEKVDAIDHYTNQINKIEAAVETWRERIAEKKPQSYGFASMAAVPYAHATAKALKNKKQRGITIELAPEPKDILWGNLTKTAAQKFSTSVTGWVLLSVLLFVNAVPLLGVALISQMASFVNVLSFLKTWQDLSGWTFAAVAALVPPAISGIMGFFLPILMRKLAKYRGERTRTQLDKVVTGQYFAFLIVSQFIVFTLIGVLITSVATLVDRIKSHTSASDVFDALGDQTRVVKKQFLNMSNYWLTWIPLRGYLALFDLAQVVKLLLVWFQKGFLGRTPRDVREYTKPPDFQYAIYYGNLLFLFAVAVIYGCLSPLVMIFCAAAFWGSLAAYKYQLMYVSVTKVESGGKLWRVIVNRILACLIFMQLIVIFVMALDQVDLTSRIIKIACSVPPIVLVLAFKIYCRKRFDEKFDWYIPGAEELSASKVHGGDARHHRLQRRFGHPSLHQRLFTPMVHARVKHLLPQVYRGRLEQAGVQDIDGRKVETEEVTGGLKIAAIEEDQLEYDPKNDSDMQSIISSTTMAGPFSSGGMGTPRGPPSRNNTYDFQNQYAAYLAGGAAQPPRGFTGEEYELNGMARGSQENLLEKAQPLSMVSDSTTVFGSGGHGRKASAGTYKTYGSPANTPGLEYPPGRSPGVDLGYQQPITHHQNDSQISIGSAGGYFGGNASASPQQYPPRAGSNGGPRGAYGPTRQTSQNSLQQQYYNAAQPVRQSPQQEAQRFYGHQGRGNGSQTSFNAYTQQQHQQGHSASYSAADMYGGGTPAPQQQQQQPRYPGPQQPPPRGGYYR